jgi:hypothetical protein
MIVIRFRLMILRKRLRRRDMFASVLVICACVFGVVVVFGMV